MARFRYRTSTLAGPWRDSRLKAECDAVLAGQARFEGNGGRFVWNVEGEIEESEDYPGGLRNGGSAG